MRRDREHDGDGRCTSHVQASSSWSTDCDDQLARMSHQAITRAAEAPGTGAASSRRSGAPMHVVDSVQRSSELMIRVIMCFASALRVHLILAHVCRPGKAGHGSARAPQGEQDVSGTRACQRNRSEILMSMYMQCFDGE